MTKENDSPASFNGSYWLFQSNSKVFRLRDALRMEALHNFPVRAHAGRIRQGDRVIIWQTGKAPGCYALATVSEAAVKKFPAKEELQFYKKAPDDELWVKLNIEYNLWKRPILKEGLPELTAFTDLYAGLPGTNYRATAAQYQALISLIQQEDMLEEPTLEYFVQTGFLPPLNLILYGPPGTGKTFRTINHALSIIENRTLEELELEERWSLKKRYDQMQKTGRIAFVTFHQSFTYEDFIEGIKPKVIEGQMSYGVESGIFKKICIRAREAAQAYSGDWSKVPRFVLIIDEINRGNLPAIFGELISLIESNKREGCPEQLNTLLPYSKENFSVPANLYILGTMNTADRSTDAMDIALRRRFSFLEVPSNHQLIPRLAQAPMVAGVDLERLLQAINDRLEILLDEQARIGHAYFLQILDLDDLRAVFELHILPLLKTYFYHDLSRIGLVLGRAFVLDERFPSDSFADFDHPYTDELLHKRRFRVRPVQELKEKDFIRIYDPHYGEDK